MVKVEAILQGTINGILTQERKPVKLEADKVCGFVPSMFGASSLSGERSKQ
jgi:hypothetical protein